MEWTTRSHLHLDRTASAWLVRRFVDAGATFRYLPWTATAEASDPRTFGVPGASLGSHDAAGTGFAKILRAEGLDGDEALVRLDRCIAAGVRHALGLSRTDDDELYHGIGVALDRIGVGLGIMHGDDDDAHLDAAAPTYDALYTALQLSVEQLTDLPTTQPERATALRALVHPLPVS